MATLPWNRLLEWARRFVLGPVGVTTGDLTWFLVRIPRFFLVVVIFYLMGKAFVWVMGRTILVSDAEDPMLRGLVESLVFVGSILLGISLGLMVFGVNILNLAVTLGLIGAGLALGLRQSVANVMGGIALATDQPFEVGDRIQIGEFWGDVVEIGLRSTRILTARREYVVIPNSLMDEREIWNYTKEYDELRLEVGCTVSYDTDVERAERIMEKVARNHQDVLDFPQPRVLARDLGEHGVELELWCFIGNARRRYDTSSDLRERIHVALQEHGVEIPYPYRTLVEKADLPEPETGVPEGFDPDDLRDRRILVAISGTRPARRKAETIAELAAELDADIVLAYISSRPSIMTERDGEMAAELLADSAAERGVRVKLVVEEGQVSDAIERLVKQEGCGAAVVGASAPPALMAWKRAGVEDRLRSVLDVPVVTIPEDLALNPRQVEAAREALDEAVGGEGEEEGEAAEG